MVGPSLAISAIIERGHWSQEQAKGRWPCGGRGRGRNYSDATTAWNRRTTATTGVKRGEDRFFSDFRKAFCQISSCKYDKRRSSFTAGFLIPDRNRDGLSTALTASLMRHFHVYNNSWGRNENTNSNPRICNCVTQLQV